MVATLRELGHEVRSSASHDDLDAIRQAIEEFKPHIVFNLMEAFADIGVFDQNVVSYLELLRVPYTGLQPARADAGARQVAVQEAARLPPHRRCRTSPSCRAAGKPIAAQEARVPAHREVAHLRGVDRHLPGVGGRQRRAAANAGAVHPREASAPTPSSSSTSTAASSTSASSGNQRLQVLPGVGDVVREDARGRWQIATERVKWSVEYQKKHGI